MAKKKEVRASSIYALWMLDCPEFDAWCEKKFPRLYRFFMSLNPDHQDPASPTEEVPE